MTRGFALIAAVAAGVLLSAYVPLVHSSAQSALSYLGAISASESQARSGGHGPGDAHGGAHGSSEGPEGVVRLTAAQISTAKIDVQQAGPGSLIRRIVAPAIVSPDPDRVIRVAAKVSGTVHELRKRLGDPVTKGEVIAVVESREVADAKSDFLAAQVTYELQSTLFERERSLFEKKIVPEQQFLRARTSLEEARLRLNLARQKLAALDLSDDEVGRLKGQPLTNLRMKDIRAPGAGQIVERRVDVGAPVGGEGQEKELYVITDNAQVWLTLSVPVPELPAIKQGQVVLASSGGREYRGKIIFISPALDAETRSARVIASVPNEDLTLRAGAFLTARIVLEEIKVDVRVPRTALQTLNGENILFVRNADGFEKREVVLGDGDEDSVAVAFGLDPGEEIAVTNTFTLKADLGKAEAEHSH